MSVMTMIMGESGTGKSSSLRNIDPTKATLIRVIGKKLPFGSKDWKEFDPKTGSGNTFTTEKAQAIQEIIKKTKKKIIIIDDFQFMMANSYFTRVKEKGFDKYSEIGADGWNTVVEATRLPDDVRVYFMWHPVTDELTGRVKPKTIGKSFESKGGPEGLFTMVLATEVVDGQYFFRTQNNGNDVAKSPPDYKFELLIPNDLDAVDRRICEVEEIER